MLVFLCPPETKMQAETLWLGNRDSELTSEGRKLAEELAYWDLVQNDRAYLAPSSHVAEFASIVLMNPYVEVVDAFTDRSMGTLTGRTYRETLAEFPRRNWLAWQRSYWTEPPEGESFFDITDRVMTAFRTEILPIKSSEIVAVIAGADVLKILIGFLSNKSEAEIPKISIEPVVPYIIKGDLPIPR